VTEELGYLTHGKGMLYDHLVYKVGELIIGAEGSDICTDQLVFATG